MKEFEKIIHYDRIGDSDMYNCHEVGEVVRCRDCKHFTVMEGERLCGAWEEIFYNPVEENGYCYKGERKDEAEMAERFSTTMVADKYFLINDFNEYGASIYREMWKKLSEPIVEQIVKYGEVIVSKDAYISRTDNTINAQVIRQDIIVKELVRCQNCKYYDKFKGVKDGECRYYGNFTYPEDFCSRGERE